MKIITAGDKKFKKIIELSVKNAKNFGYPIIIYDLGELGFGRKYDVNKENFLRKNEGKTPISCEYKPSMIRHCLDKAKEGETFVYLDGDAYILQNIDELETNDYDIAVTLRTIPEIKTYGHKLYMGAINAGVIILRKTEKTIVFLKRWANQIGADDSDQLVLNKILKNHIDIDKIGETVERDGLKVKLLTTKIYNNYYSISKDELPKVKIRHLKGNNKNNMLI